MTAMTIKEKQRFIDGIECFMNMIRDIEEESINNGSCKDYSEFREIFSETVEPFIQDKSTVNQERAKYAHYYYMMVAIENQAKGHSVNLNSKKIISMKDYKDKMVG